MEYECRRRFRGRVEDSAALFLAFRGGRSWLTVLMALGDNVEDIEPAREVPTEVTASVATELADWSTGGCKTWLVWPRFPWTNRPSTPRKFSADSLPS